VTRFFKRLGVVGTLAWLLIAAMMCLLAVNLASRAAATEVPAPVVPKLPLAATTPATDLNPCKLAGWFVNDPDELHRTPTRTNEGFEFEATDLIHHASPAIPLKYLKPGWFVATPAPDQPSFFSVEIRDLTTDAYATLRWNKTTAMWDAVLKGVLVTKATPQEFIGLETKWGKITAAARVVTFGVGYTNSPAGTVKTTVKTIAFAGKVYTLTCPKPTASPTATPTTTPSSTGSPSTSTSVSPSTTGSPSSTPSSTQTASPSTSASSSATPSKSSTTTSPPSVVPLPDDNTSGRLPTTGASVGGLFLLGCGVVLAGGLLTWWFRKRKRRGINAPY